jgi:hypothetical protein
LAWLLGAAACWGAPSPEVPGGPLVFSLAEDSATKQPAVKIMGWSSAELAALDAADLTADAWSAIIRLTVDGVSDVAVAANYRVTSDAVEVVPQFGMDPGRAYVVSVEASRLPVPRSVTPASPVSARLVVPLGPPSEPTTVTAIYPSADVWPENILRFYLHFSSAMSAESAVGHVRLIDEDGQEVVDALLEVDVDLWDTTYTRRTVFFDPGRVKQGIRPNRELGRALTAGRRYAIVVGEDWPDASRQPLKNGFRHEFTAGAAIEQGLAPTQWLITPPPAGTREALVVQFPWPLDEGLLHRAVGVTSEDGTAVDGRINIGPDQTSWTFTPDAPWQRAPHALVVLSLLEDPSGNKVGEAFEFEMFEQPMTATPERISLPFQLR